MADAISTGISAAIPYQADRLLFMRSNVRGQSLGIHSGDLAVLQRKGVSDGHT
ncbi:hypothetical protein K2Y11_21310 [bacterium]|nr:hypothetical protein [bacterium]